MYVHLFSQQTVCNQPPYIQVLIYDTSEEIYRVNSSWLSVSNVTRFLQSDEDFLLNLH